MADITAIFGILIFLGISYPGLLFAWKLLLPKIVERGQVRLEATPWSCFWLGSGVAVVSAVSITILFALPFGPAELIGFSLLVLVLAFSTLGAAGLAGWMGDEILRRMDGNISTTGAFLRGAIAIELAAAFPLIGWFIFIPLSSITVLGASTFALLRWLPNKRTSTIPVQTQSAQGELPGLSNETIVS